jgi:hypothetical protein
MERAAMDQLLTLAPLRWDLGNATRTDPDLRAHGVNNWNLAIAKMTPSFDIHLIQQ